MSKNSENFNISKGTVKGNDINVAQRNSQDDELMKKIFPHKEVINGKIVLVFPYIEEVYPLKDVPQEVISKMETTTLTKQYKTGTLPNDFYYFDNGKTQYIVEYHNIKGVEGLDGVKVLERVPSYDHFVELTEKVKENKKLKELLKEWIHYYPIILYEYEDTLKTKDIVELFDKTREALK